MAIRPSRFLQYWADSALLVLSTAGPETHGIAVGGVASFSLSVVAVRIFDLSGLRGVRLAQRYSRLGASEHECRLVWNPNRSRGRLLVRFVRTLPATATRASAHALKQRSTI